MKSCSKSAITFKEFEKKLNHFHEFGNEWGLYIDIEKNNTDIEVTTRRLMRVNEYGMPEYVIQVQQIINIKKEMPKTLPLKTIKEYDISIINDHKNDKNIQKEGGRLSLYKLFIVSTSISVIISTSFFIYFSFSNYLKYYK